MLLTDIQADMIIAALREQLVSLADNYTGPVTTVLHANNGAFAVMEYIPLIKVQLTEKPPPVERLLDSGRILRLKRRGTV